MRDYNFGNFLHELRLHRGLTQYQLGALVGVSDKAVSKWESGLAKPQSHILCKLSEVLGISVDELLSCQYRSREDQDEKGVFTMKKELWNKALTALHRRYGDCVPVEITNRFLTEQAELEHTDMIVYFDMLAMLSSEAKKQGEHILVKGGAGASFVAYLLGATEINPLKPHSYCPVCHTVVFDHRADDGWDLPPRTCSCGRMMVSDGHNIPFETYRHVTRRNTGFDVSVSPHFLNQAKDIIRNDFQENELTLADRDGHDIMTFTVTSGEASCSVTLCADAELERYRALEQATATAFERINFCRDDVLQGFRSGNTGSIPEYKSEFTQKMLSKIQPTSFRELIQICGLSHGTGVWSDNADALIDKGISAGDVIAYRDDVFNYIQCHMLNNGFSDTGFAYRIMENTRRGLYAKSGVSDETREQLRSIGMDDWFSDSIARIRYLFPKAHGITYVRLAATLMWYKLHYPEEFNECMHSSCQNG